MNLHSPAYEAMVNTDNSLNMAEIMRFAHNRVKNNIKLYAGRLTLDYAEEFKECLAYAWSWAKAIAEYKGRT